MVILGTSGSGKTQTLKAIGWEMLPSRSIIERIDHLFSNPGPVLSELLGAIGIPLLRGAYGGTDAQQSRAIQISDLVVKVAEIDRGKTEVTAKTRERVQQMILDFDIFAREFQAEQAIWLRQRGE
jgi:hypothetical protein